MVAAAIFYADEIYSAWQVANVYRGFNSRRIDSDYAVQHRSACQVLNNYAACWFQ